MFRIYRKYVFQELSIENNNFLAITEIKVKALRKNISFYEFPTTNFFRKFGQSKMKVFKNIAEHLVFMFKIFFRIE
jgi:hypothetical protein